jgi:hypothetical protein
MIDELLRLKEEAQALEPNETKRSEIRNEVIQYAEEFLNTLDQLPAYVVPADQLNILHEDCIDHQSPIAAVSTPLH